MGHSFLGNLFKKKPQSRSTSVATGVKTGTTSFRRFWPGAIEPPNKSLATWIVWEKDVLNVSESLSTFDPHLATYEQLLKSNKIKYTRRFVGIEQFGEIRRRHNTGIEQSQTDVEQEIRSYLENAVEHRASDIHLDVFEEHAVLQFRIDDRMKRILELRAGLAKKVISVIFNAYVDIGGVQYLEGTNQSGRFKKEKLPNGVQGIRLETGRHHQGIFMVLRLLWDHKTIEGSTSEVLIELGYSQQNADSLAGVSGMPDGLNLVAGSIGSGKTTLLMHVMESMTRMRPDLQFTSVEDPPESIMRGVRQIPMVETEKDEREDAYEKLQRSVLRSNPNILMYGEIRDSTTAALVVDAALIGHQIFSTIHASSTFAIFERLARLLCKADGCSPRESMEDLCSNAIISSMTYQRLTPVLCPHCKKPFIDNWTMFTPGRILGVLATYNFPNAQDILLCYKKDKDIKKVIDLYGACLKPIYVVNEKGCKHCKGTGLRTRTVLAEVVITDPEIFGWIRADGINVARQKWLNDAKRHGEHGGQTLQEHARGKIAAGLIDPLLTEQRIGRLFADQLLSDNVYEAWEVELMGML